MREVDIDEREVGIMGREKTEDGGQSPLSQPQCQGVLLSHWVVHVDLPATRHLRHRRDCCDCHRSHALSSL